MCQTGRNVFRELGAAMSGFLNVYLKAQARRKELRTAIIAVLLILLVAGLGLFSLARLSTLHGIITDIQTSHVATLRDMNEIAATSERVRNLQSLTLLTKDDALKAEVAKRKELVEARRQTRWNAHQARLTTQEDKDAFAPVAKAWDEYVQLSGLALALHDAGEDDKAIAFLNTEAQQGMDRYRKALNNYVEYQTNQIQSAVHEGDVMYEESRMILFFVFLFATPMCLLAGVSMASVWL